MLIYFDQVATGARIKELCNEKGISAKRLSSEFDITIQSIHKWFHGLTKPSIENFIGLSLLLNVPLEDILIYEDRDKERYESR